MSGRLIRVRLYQVIRYVSGQVDRIAPDSNLIVIWVKNFVLCLLHFESCQPMATQRNFPFAMNYVLDFPVHIFQEFLIPGRGWLFETPYSWMKHLRHTSSHYQKLDLWIMQFKSFHDLAIIGYGSLYCVRARRRATPEAFLYIVTIRCSYKIKLARLMYKCPRAFLIQQLFHYHRISNKRGWTNCLLRVL